MGTILFPLCFCGITAGNVINIFFINDVLLYPFASNLLLIRMIPLYDGTDGKVPQLSFSRGYDEGICSGAVKWKCFNGRLTGSALQHMHLALKVNRKVYSDSGLHKPVPMEISGKQKQPSKAVVAMLTYGISAKHTELIMSSSVTMFFFNALFLFDFFILFS